MRDANIAVIGLVWTVVLVKINYKICDRGKTPHAMFYGVGNTAFQLFKGTLLSF